MVYLHIIHCIGRNFYWAYRIVVWLRLILGNHCVYKQECLPNRYSAL